jgi:hypothetical protein
MNKKLASAVFGLSVLSVPAGADTYVVPSLIVAVLTDDNILISADDRRNDIVTRVSPGLAVGHETERFQARASYIQDFESYRENSGLDSAEMRRFLETSLLYRLSQLVVFSVDANYSESRIPAELNISTGVGQGRVQGERTTIHPALSYRFSETSSAQIDYRHMQDRLAGGVDGDTNALNVEYEHLLTTTTQMTYGYTYTHFSFDNAATGVSGVSDYVHAPRIGIYRNLSAFTSLSAQVGPRFSTDEVGVNFAVTLQRHYINGRFMIGYDRGAASLIGEPGLVDLRVFNVSATHEFTNNFELSLVASSGEVMRDNSSFSDARIHRAGVSARYRFNEFASVSASYSYSHQRISEFSGRNVIPRNVAMIALTLTYPRRSESVEFVRR